MAFKNIFNNAPKPDPQCITSTATDFPGSVASITNDISLTNSTTTSTSIDKAVLDGHCKSLEKENKELREADTKLRQLIDNMKTLIRKQSKADFLFEIERARQLALTDEEEAKNILIEAQSKYERMQQELQIEVAKVHQQSSMNQTAIANHLGATANMSPHDLYKKHLYGTWK